MHYTHIMKYFLTLRVIKKKSINVTKKKKRFNKYCGNAFVIVSESKSDANTDLCVFYCISIKSFNIWRNAKIKLSLKSPVSVDLSRKSLQPWK